MVTVYGGSHGRWGHGLQAGALPLGSQSEGPGQGTSSVLIVRQSQSDDADDDDDDGDEGNDSTHDADDDRVHVGQSAGLLGLW